MGDGYDNNDLQLKRNSRRSFLKNAGFTMIGLAAGMKAMNRENFSLEKYPGLSQLGASTACLAGYTIIDALQQLKELGFSTVEIIAYTGAQHSVGNIPGFSLHNATKKQQQLVFDATRSFSHISAHLPFTDLHYFSGDPDVRAFSVGQLRRGIDTIAFLKGEFAVIHTGWPPTGKTYKEIWKQIINTFRQLGDYAGKKGIKIGLETMQPASVNEFSQLILDIDHPFVGATIDTGHIRGSSDINLTNERKYTTEGRERFNDVLMNLVTILGDKVLHYHLTDVTANDWIDHKTIGTGIIDFPRLFNHLKLQGYKGLLIFELEEADTVNALRNSKKNIEQLMRF